MTELRFCDTVQAVEFCDMKEGMKDADTKELARILYTEGYKTVTEISDTLKVAVKEVTEWVDAGGWAEVRRSMAGSKQEQLKRLYEMVEQINIRMVTGEDQSSKDIDLLMKYVSMIGKLESEDNLYRTIEMAEDFLKWLYKKDRKQAQHYVTIYDNYIKELTSRQPL